MKQNQLEKYAQLIAEVGANVQKGQYVIIRAEVALENFAVLVAEKCYERGAKKVIYEWTSSKAKRVEYNNASTDSLSEVLTFEEEYSKFSSVHFPILIWIDGEDPDGLNGVDAKKVAQIRSARGKILHRYREMTEDKAQWCIVGYPTEEWARKVFPGDERAKEKLLEQILHCARADSENPIEAWEKHEKDLKARCEYLNTLNLRSLHYTSERGTDLTVGLIPGVKFLAGGEKTLDGIDYQPNIPTEECFTSPMRGKAEGVVYASKPLVYNGQVIRNFKVVFKGGKAIDVSAEEGEDVLRSILSLDEGACYLGECAFVPYRSPINDTGILFFNTLFDENASCHLALGRGFQNLYPGFENMTVDELLEKGINNSISHVDFMIGDETLNITGTDQDGKEIPIFENGSWAF